jgi:hypothetical protein
METVFMLLITLSVLHYAVVFYGTMARRVVGWVISLAQRRNAVSGQRGTTGDQSGQGWPPPL